MHRIRLQFLLLCLLISYFSYAFANSEWQTLVVPTCLVDHSIQYKTLAKSKQLMLIQIKDLAAFHALRMAKNNECRGFINATSAWQSSDKTNPDEFLNHYMPNNNSDFVSGYKIQYQTSVKPLLNQLNDSHIKYDLQILSKLPDRHVDSAEGVRTANWIKYQLQQMIANRAQKDVEIFTISTINHAKQPSVVAKIGKSSLEPGILIGTHMDTLDRRIQHQLGITETGSGVVTMLETARLLLQSDLNFKRPIYLVWYSGQDEGSLGVQSVVGEFSRQHLAIDAVLHLDDTGYVGKERSIGLTDDLTDAGLTTFVADLVTTYIKLPVGVVNCGFACSDHTTWHQNGIRVAYPYTTMHENDFAWMNKTTSKLKSLSITHMLDFVKLAVAFAVELAEPQ